MNSVKMMVVRDSNVMSEKSCACCKKGYTGCEEDFSRCGYELADEEEIKRRLFIKYHQLKAMEHDNETEWGSLPLEINSLITAFINKYGHTGYEIFDMGIDHKICPNCYGTGTSIGATVEPCKICDGKGIVSKLIPDKYIVLYMTYWNTDNGIVNRANVTWKNLDESFVVDYIAKNKEDVEHYRENLISTNYLNESSIGVGRMIVPDELKDSNLNSDGDVLIAYDTDINQIVGMGDWMKLHEMADLSPHIDMRQASNLRIGVLPVDKFHEKYTITPINKMNLIYQHVLRDIVTEYIPHASYGGADELWLQYTNKFRSFNDILENIVEYTQPDQRYYVVTGDDHISLLLKIADDFSLFGVTISKTQAAYILDQVGLVDEVNTFTRLTSFHAVAVFLVEHIFLFDKDEEE